MTTPPVTLPMHPGRPPKHPWPSLKPEIEALIAQGYGYQRLGTRYGVTSAAMVQTLRKLGLKTLRSRA